MHVYIRPDAKLVWVNTLRVIPTPKQLTRHGDSLMKQCIPSLALLLAPLAPAFRAEAFAMFGMMTAAWIVCLGRRSISRVWETTGQAEERNHTSAFRLYHQAVWNWVQLFSPHGFYAVLVMVKG